MGRLLLWASWLGLLATRRRQENRASRGLCWWLSVLQPPAARPWPGAPGAAGEGSLSPPEGR